MRLIRKIVKQSLNHFGYQIRRSDRVMDGRNAFVDMAAFVERTKPVCFDVGANIGQTVIRFHKYLKKPIIHSFEPGVAAYKEFEANTENVVDLTRNNIGLGSHAERRVFYENSDSTMSSFLQPGTECWGEIAEETSTDIVSVDSYCEEHEIDKIDVLKTDTQGFDFEVIKGADRMMQQARIQLIFTEVIFNDQYEGQPEFDEMYRYLVDRGYRLVSFYEFFFRNKRAAFTDAMFVHPDYSVLNA